jgi:hypothetical protein
MSRLLQKGTAWTRPTPGVSNSHLCAGEAKPGTYPQGKCQDRHRCSKHAAWIANKDDPNSHLSHVMALPRVAGNRCHYFRQITEVES